MKKRKKNEDPHNSSLTSNNFASLDVIAQEWTRK